MKTKESNHETRTSEQIKEHYEIEKELADRLRNASKQSRHQLYAAVYDELFQRVPTHPQLTRKVSFIESIRVVQSQLNLLKRFLNSDLTFIEIGPGDCALSFEVAKSVKQVYAIDVSDEITHASTTPENFQLILSDGCSVPLPAESVDLAYSNQLMEHLHPDDAFEQLQQICKALKPGGKYLCITPNRLTGPHDISTYFDAVATGFHLKEYSTRELTRLFQKVGFSKVHVYLGAKGLYLKTPSFPINAAETLLESLPAFLRKPILHNRLLAPILGIRILGIK